MANSVGPHCLSCNQPLQTTALDDHTAECVHCKQRVLTDDRFREAMAIATANDGWIEKVFWKERDTGWFNIVRTFLIDFPRTAIIFVGPLIVVFSLGFATNYFGPPVFTWFQWMLIPIVLLAAYVFLRLLRTALQKWFPNQHVNVVWFIMCSRGMVIVDSLAKPMLLPWSSIVDYSFFGQASSLSSVLRIDYATADHGVAHIVLDGEEKVQPLGEVVDILNARRKGTGADREGES